MKLTDLITKFESYLLTEKRVADNTFAAYRQDLRQFATFCDQEGLRDFEQLDRSVLSDFLAYLKDAGLSVRSVARKIAALKGLCSYGENRFEIPDVAKELQVPKIKITLPEYLSESEMEELFTTAKQGDSLSDKRNLVMLYIMYVTGMRVSELVGLKVTNLQDENSCLHVDGKGGRQRIIPIPDSMVSLLKTYIQQTREVMLEKHGVTEFLFPSVYGGKLKSLSRQAFWVIVKQLWKRSGIKKPVSPHTLRHSFATHMLQKGLNLRSLQVLLGHEQLATVQMYTHVETSHLRTVYDKKHPRS